MYLPQTAVLITRFVTEEGVGEVVDFMPVRGPRGHREPPARPDAALRARRRSTFEVDVAPRFDYGRVPHETEVTEHGVVFRTDALTLTLHPVREPDDARLAHVRIDDGDVRVSIGLS